ncbi:hypothetical protein F6455_06605 [Proteobacteria bacterium 005FR1]|nr:hypothetical protein [Proteobacteria bacterium 005FR1]
MTSSASSLRVHKSQTFFHSAGEGLLALVLLAILPFFFVGAPAWMATDVIRALANLAHIGFFALATVLVAGRVDLRSPRRWLLLTGVVVIISLLIELIQSQVGRSATVHDGLRNLTGTWLAILWLQRPSAGVWLGRAIVGGVLLLELGLVAETIAAQQRMRAQLPLLSGMESVWDVNRWQGIASEVRQSDDHASEGTYALEARLGPTAFSGISMTRMPNDWSAYGELSFDVYNPQAKKLQLTVRIHDADHEIAEAAWRFEDRFNRRLLVEPGWNHYRISLAEVQQSPEEREMDMSLIKELRLFAAGLEEEKIIYLDNFLFD